MGDTLQEKMLKQMMAAYESKSRDWEYEDEEDTWSDFDREDDEEYEAGTEYAVILMDELTENNLDSHILLKYPEIANWWGTVLKDRNFRAEKKRKAEEKRRKAEEDARARELLVSRLTPEERRLLRIK